ncbi:ROK family protein [Mariprofundus sp. EBB-1]|uniref:ROK family protein n=1 Tax=Mariprofundus sp. EBB-1 TaxID=2650971 RepID=UPI000EF24D98|nr:ROK family protein [Mariprofundus sp. EBB-1]RLL53704.1 ROK family protein [Mariprofundus sp. EBB-1]
MQHILAADIGGTNLRLAITDQTGKILDESRVQAELSLHNAASKRAAEAHIITTISHGIHTFLKQSSYRANSIGIGFPGFFHGQTGVLASSPNLPLLHDFRLAELLSNSIDKPVAVQNDALCAAIGEHRFGAGQGQNNLLHITLGTGVGGGLILNHKPYGGEHGMAMEFGHLCVERAVGNSRPCGCGNTGCLESYASASAVIQIYQEKTGLRCSAKDIYHKARSGDDVAQRILTQAGTYLGMAIAETIKLLDISTITVSGGLSGAWPIIHPALIESLDANLIPPLKGKTTVLQSTLADNAGLLGAAAIAPIR